MGAVNSRTKEFSAGVAMPAGLLHRLWTSTHFFRPGGPEWHIARTCRCGGSGIHGHFSLLAAREYQGRSSVASDWSYRRGEDRSTAAVMSKGILYDATVRIGCKLSEKACAERNGLPYDDAIANEEKQ